MARYLAKLFFKRGVGRKSSAAIVGAWRTKSCATDRDGVCALLVLILFVASRPTFSNPAPRHALRLVRGLAMSVLSLSRLKQTSSGTSKIDRLAWVTGMAFTSYGLRIGIRVDNPAILDQLVNRLPPGWRRSTTTVVDRLYSVIADGRSTRANVRGFNLLYAGAVRLAQTMEPQKVLEALESDLQLYVAEMARRRVFVHAGVVGWEGRAIVIPGRSFSGKSTLVAAFVRAGATYYSDEYAVFDARGFVHPFARALTLRRDGGGRPERRSVADLGGQRGDKPLPVGLVVVTKYQAGARWRPRPLSPGKATLALLANTVSIRRQPEIALAKLKRVVAHARALKGLRGEAAEVVAPLLEAAALESVIPSAR
jgi:hypothetical protein